MTGAVFAFFACADSVVTSSVRFGRSPSSPLLPLALLVAASVPAEPALLLVLDVEDDEEAEELALAVLRAPA